MILALRIEYCLELEYRTEGGGKFILLTRLSGQA